MLTLNELIKTNVINGRLLVDKVFVDEFVVDCVQYKKAGCKHTSLAQVLKARPEFGKIEVKHLDKQGRRVYLTTIKTKPVISPELIFDVNLEELDIHRYNNVITVLRDQQCKEVISLFENLDYDTQEVLRNKMELRTNIPVCENLEDVIDIIASCELEVGDVGSVDDLICIGCGEPVNAEYEYNVTTGDWGRENYVCGHCFMTAFDEIEKRKNK